MFSRQRYNNISTNGVHDLTTDPLLSDTPNLRPHSLGRSTTFHMSYVISKRPIKKLSMYQLERLFPIWRHNVEKLPTKTPSIIHNAMDAVHDIYNGVPHQNASFLVSFLLRCFLVAIVEPGREVLTPFTWSSARVSQVEDNEALEHFLESKFIRVEDLPDCTILHVRLPERAARFIAESHSYILQLDPFVTPHGIDNFYGNTMHRHPNSDEQDRFFKKDIKEETANGLKHQIKIWANKYFWWLSIHDAGNKFYLPYVSYNSEADEPPCNFYGVQQIGRIFARYDLEDHLVLKDGPLSKKQQRTLSLFRDVVNIEALVQFGILDSWYPLHREELLYSLKKNWATYQLIFVFNQPLDEICNYFGEQIAMYFAFLMQYVHALKVPALVGFTIFIFGIMKEDNNEYATIWFNYFQLGYCLFIMIWITLFNQKWSRFESWQRSIWGLDPLRSVNSTTPSDALDENLEYIETIQNRLKRIDYLESTTAFRSNTFYMKPYPWDIQLARGFISFLVTFIATFLAVFLLNSDLTDYFLILFGFSGKRKVYTVVYNYMDSIGQTLGWDELTVRERTAGFFITITSIIIKLLDAISSKLAIPLTKLENHPTLTAYKDWASIKFFLFKFCIHFCPLLYLAFFKSSFYPCDDVLDGRCIFDLRKQLVTLFTIDVFKRIVKRSLNYYLIPYRHFIFHLTKQFMYAYFRHLMTKVKTIFSRNGHRLSKQEACKIPYDGLRGIIVDYQEITTNVDLVALFSMVFPVLPLLALVVSLIEIRSDAIKLCELHQRPFPVRDGMIRVWSDTMRAMAFATIITNGYMAAFETVGYLWPSTIKLLMFLCIVVIGMGCKELVHILYPNEGKKEELLRAQMYAVLHDAVVGPRTNAILKDFSEFTRKYV